MNLKKTCFFICVWLASCTQSYAMVSNDFVKKALEKKIAEVAAAEIFAMQLKKDVRDRHKEIVSYIGVYKTLHSEEAKKVYHKRIERAKMAKKNLMVQLNFRRSERKKLTEEIQNLVGDLPQVREHRARKAAAEGATAGQKSAQS
jgi:hypothetical protein